ncbi:MAG: EAL domain-containing protein [Deltaproteobacteria bacterium]|nr:EAL domain-containing protein [Deltaproteobacteria bacterium]
MLQSALVGSPPPAVATCEHSALDALVDSLVASGPDGDVAAVLTQRLRELTGAVAVTYASYDEATGELVPRHIAMEATVLQSVLRALGVKLDGMRLAVSEDMRQRMLAEVVARPVDLHELSFGRIPRPVSTAVHAVAGISEIAALALRQGERVLGTVALFMPKGRAAPPDVTLYAFAYVSVLAILQRETALALRSAETRFRQLFEVLPEGVALVDLQSGLFLQVNRRFTELVGFDRESIMGRRLSEVGILAEPETGVRLLGELERGRRCDDVEFRARTGSGETRTIAMSAEVVDLEGRACVLGVFRDVEYRRQLEERLQHQATHDAVTGLPNRLLFRDRLAQALHSARRSGKPAAIVLMDLDRFKSVNDSLGHPAGDALLRETGRRLSACVRRSDTVARLGGDEFGLVLPEIGGPAGAVRVLDRLHAALAAPFLLEGRPLAVTASIGISCSPADGEDADTLVRNADIALYRAKEAGRDNHQFFEAAMGRAAAERALLEGDLRGALEAEQFRLHYQVQFDTESSAPAGVEALLRWQHPQRGVISPGLFLPIARETGLIRPIGSWVLREALRQARRWDDAGVPPVRVAVNLDARQLDDERLPDELRGWLEEAGLPPQRLEVEVTEDGVMERAARAAAVLCRLRELGVHLALDDFGTGHSSLTWLQRFPVDTVKIGQEFVRGLAARPELAAMLDSIRAMTRALGIERLVVEGVETEAEVKLLRKAGFHTMQGYYFARPLPEAEAAAVLRRGCTSPTSHP